MQIIVYHSKARKTMCGMGTFCLIGMISLQLTIQNGETMKCYRQLPNVDLNTVLQPGFYMTDYTGTDIRNGPDTGDYFTGIFAVFGINTYVAQLFVKNSGGIFVRTNFYNSWTTWARC